MSWSSSHYPARTGKFVTQIYSSAAMPGRSWWCRFHFSTHFAACRPYCRSNLRRCPRSCRRRRCPSGVGALNAALMSARTSSTTAHIAFAIRRFSAAVKTLVERVLARVLCVQSLNNSRSESLVLSAARSSSNGFANAISARDFVALERLV